QALEQEGIVCGVEGQGGVEGIDHRRTDDPGEARHGAEAVGFGDRNAGVVKRVPAASAAAAAQESNLVGRGPVDRREFAVQCGGGGGPAEDKLSLILSKLSDLQDFVARGFTKQAGEQEKLQAGQRRLEEEIGRLRDSLPNISSTPSRCRANLRGAGRNDRGLSGPVERAPLLSAGTGESGFSIVQAGVADPTAPVHDGAVSAQGGGTSPDSHTSSSWVLPAASGKQQQQQQQQPIG
ncbi:unnamed protein product, partial [Scytosiphon promiscuus]